MATNMLPILALGAAALFLMKKKGTPSTNGNGTNGNGNGTNGANGTGTNGSSTGPEQSTITEGGLYDVKAGETLDLLRPQGRLWAGWVTSAQFNDENIASVTSTDAFVFFANQDKKSISFRPLKAGKVELTVGVEDYEGQSVPAVHFTFIVT